ncbi:hypothetical protein [Mycolicibacterium mengxianglii]|uniref:hypothetical protein n=1 Tax=Mycolicibacterium mengxianglii TaxID=2736649 RepID=UPI0018EEE0F1
MNLGELGDFVKSRRARIRPADIGLPPGNRRRVPGLRREEVAQLAGASTDYHDGAATCRLDRPCSLLRGVPAAEVSDGYGIPLGAAPGWRPRMISVQGRRPTSGFCLHSHVTNDLDRGVLRAPA